MLTMVGPLFIQVFIEELDPHEIEHLRDAINVVNGSQTSFRIRDRLKDIELPGQVRRNAEKCLDYLADHFPKNRDRIICITSREFTDYSFSVDDRRRYITSIYDWEAEYAPPSLATYLVYEIAAACACFAADLTSEQIG